MPQALNAQSYLNLLRTEVEDQLEELSVARYHYIVFQHDDAPAHFARSVREYLDTRFPEWIGRRGTIFWPARSPDVTPLDFFLWGYIKNVVYAEDCQNIKSMKRKIEVAFSTITPQMLQNVRRSLNRRTELCIEREGRHFEPFL